MQNTALLQADVLDIIFEGRNKEYGAYDLRRTYNKRLKVSIAVMLLVVLLFTAGQLIGGNGPDKQPMLVISDTVFLAPPPENEPPPPPPPPAPPPAQQQVRTIQVTTPRIEPDENVSPDEVPPEVDDMENARIDLVNRDGSDDVGIVAPPSGPVDGKGIVDVPKSKDNPDSLFITVQIESAYPGGTAAWQRFLHKNLRYPQQAQDDGIQGTVEVQFIVDKEGKVSDVRAISGPEELRAEAERVIRKSGKWTPAIQNGLQVKSYKRQPIGFKLYEE